MKNNWQVKKLGEIFDITSSKRVFKHEWTNQGIPFFRAREVVNLAVGKKFKSPIFISEEMYKKYSSRYGVPKEGDILVTGVGTLGICYLVKKGDKFYFKDGNIIWFKKNSNVDSRYVEYFFQSNQLKDDIKSKANGATVGTFTIKTAKETEIPLPPLKIQKEIVAKLDEKFAKIREAKRLREESLTDTEKILSQTLREIFEEGKQKGWKDKSIEEITEVVTKGTTPKTLGKSYTDFGVPFLKAENIAGGPVDLNLLRTFIAVDTNDLLNRSKTKSGDVLMTIAGTIGRVGYLPENSPEMNTNQAVAIIRPKHEIISSIFLTYALQSPFIQKGIWSGVVKAAIPNFSLTRIKEISMPVPSIDEQQKIVTKLDKLSEKIKNLHELQTAQLADLKRLEKSYLSEAFNGELI